MKANKLFPYFVAVSFILLLLSVCTDPPIGGIPELIVIILLNTVFCIFCKGWRRFLAIGFIILGIYMCFSEVQSQRTLDEKFDRIRKNIENYYKTNTPAVSPETNSNK